MILEGMVIIQSHILKSCFPFTA